MQEGLAAVFGNGLPTACIVNIGAQVTSVICVEVILICFLPYKIWQSFLAPSISLLTQELVEIDNFQVFILHNHYRFNHTFLKANVIEY